VTKPVRFAIVHGDTVEPVDAPSPEVVLSKLLNRAQRDDAGGEWLVREYEDTVYRVRREPGAKGRVTVAVSA
jgi:hypothetical protein